MIMSIKVVSFDVFDTCLMRSCGTPSGFFDVLSYKVFTEDVDESVRQSFVSSRRKAEQDACRVKQAPSIYEIYNELSFDHPKLKQKALIIDEEMNLEKEVLFPNLAIKSLINDYRNKGTRIIFISDMYLPGSFLRSILESRGIMQETDGLYVSCDYGHTKEKGDLFAIIHEKESIDYINWIHFGDNQNSDIKSPSSLGIKTSRIKHIYNPYPLMWVKYDNPARFKYGRVLAGLSRSLHYSLEINKRTDFLLDIVGPFYCSFCCNLFKEAIRKGVKKLYFCARDTFQLYKVATIISRFFPEIDIDYLFISRTSLYECAPDLIIEYFKQVGLASLFDDTAIVDINSTGKTLSFVNSILTKNGFCRVKGFVFTKSDDNADLSFQEDLSYVLKQTYSDDLRMRRFFIHIPILEMIMSTNTQSRTIGYAIKEGGDVVPLFSQTPDLQDYVQDDLDYWSKIHEETLSQYAEQFMNLELYRYSFEVMDNVVLPTLISFFNIPKRHYLKALLGIHICDNTGWNIQYVRKENLFSLAINIRKRTYWRIGSLIVSLPPFLSNCFCKYVLHPTYKVN